MSGVAPTVYGCDRNWNRERLREVLGDALRPTSSLRTPVSVVMLEYIADSVPLSVDSVTWRICKDALGGLDLIHLAQVVHHDIREPNILIVPSTGRVVWIDFSSSFVNPNDSEIWNDRQVAYSLLYLDVVDHGLCCGLILAVNRPIGGRIPRSSFYADSVRSRRKPLQWHLKTP